MDLSHLDDASAYVAIWSQIQDLKQLQAPSRRKGKQREGELTNTQAIIALLEEQRGALRTRIADRVEAFKVQEEEFSKSDVEVHSAKPISSPGDPASYVPERWADNLNDSDVSGQPGPSTRAAKRVKTSHPTLTCTACREEFQHQPLTAPCSHIFCTPCVRELFTSALTDESLFPPGCCQQPIPIEGNSRILGDLAEEFHAKKIEFETADRVYCSVPTCSTFIPPLSIVEKLATCPKCNEPTCASCKETHHPGACAVEENLAVEQTLELAKAQGWQRCPQCNRVIELGHGCYHITCLCKAEFCYLCNVEWKKCDCPLWDEERLAIQAVPIWGGQQELPDLPGGPALPNPFRAPALPNILGAPGLPDIFGAQGIPQMDPVQRAAPAEPEIPMDPVPVQRAAAVEQEQHRPVENHNCTHEDWTRSRRPGGYCDDCPYPYVMRSFSFVCDQCRRNVCGRCRQRYPRNRRRRNRRHRNGRR